MTVSESGEAEFNGNTVTVYSVDNALTAGRNESNDNSGISYENVALRYYVNDEGQIVAYERTMTIVNHDDNITVDLRSTARIVNIGSTTFDDPEWLDEAREES